MKDFLEWLMIIILTALNIYWGVFNLKTGQIGAASISFAIALWFAIQMTNSYSNKE